MLNSFRVDRMYRSTEYACNHYNNVTSKVSPGSPVHFHEYSLFRTESFVTSFTKNPPLIAQEFFRQYDRFNTTREDQTMKFFSKDITSCKSFGILGIKLCPSCNKETPWILCIARTWAAVLNLKILPIHKDYRAACSECNNGLAMSRASFESLYTKLSCGDSIGRIEDAIRFPDKSARQIKEILAAESIENEEILEMEEKDKAAAEQLRVAEQEALRKLTELENSLIGSDPDAEATTESAFTDTVDKDDPDGFVHSEVPKDKKE